MEPRPNFVKKRRTSTVMLFISLAIHALIIAGLVFFAAREGYLGKELKKIAVEMVKEKQPEKPKEPEKPKDLPKVETPKEVAAPKVQAPTVTATTSAPPPVNDGAAPPAVAPAAADLGGFQFEGGKAVQTSSDPVELYKGSVEYALRSKWNRPADMEDETFVAEVEVSVDREGQISKPTWKTGSGDNRWDESVRKAIAVTKTINRPPPTNFPPRILVRFDVETQGDPVNPLQQLGKQIQ